MKLVTKEIESWIKPYVTVIGDDLNLDKGLMEADPAQYFIKATLPPNFDAYAIALSSFWIYNKIAPECILPYNSNNELQVAEEDYERLKWKDFYKSKGIEFNLNMAILDDIKPPYSIVQMNNELYPGEGMMDKEHLESFIDVAISLYGDHEIEAFYIFLSTYSYEDRLFKGMLSSLPNLWDNEDLKYTPSLIYAKEKKWAINTDTDLKFSTIGGDSKLIDELVRRNKDEIYRIY